MYIRKMLGLISYRRETLKLIEDSKESKIQELESIEQLWLILNNYDIYGINMESCLPSVNTPNDVNRVLKYIEQNSEQQGIIKEVSTLN